MYSGKYYPWDEYPKFLLFDEIQEPLKVLINYFGGNWPAEHRRELKEWLKYVLKDEHYQHKHGPGSLLFISDEHMRLLEACYLLSFTYSDYELRTTNIVSKEELTTGREKWFYFPDNLSEKELSNPYRTLKKVFKKHSLAEYRDHLKEWLHAALYNSHIDETVTAGEIFSVYENMKKLASAAWMIRQTEASRPMLKRELRKEHDKQTDDDDEQADIDETEDYLPQLKTEATVLKTFAPIISHAEKMGLDEVVALIRKDVPSVRSITYLGTCHTPFTFYLLILIDDDEKTQEHSLVNKIENNCRNLVQVYVMVHKVQSAVSGLLKGSRFWTAALQKGINIYRDDDLRLPEPLKITIEEEQFRAKSNWERWGKQGHDFLLGAGHYMKNDNYKLALFMLHQAMESTLIGFIKVVFGYRQSAHNLLKLLKLTQLFTDDLMEVFELNEKEGMKVFTLLSSGYSEARYKEGFDPDPTQVVAANLKVYLLLEKAEAICNNLIKDKV